MDDGFRAGRASRDVNIDRKKVVATLHNAITAVHSTRRGTGTHGDAPLWISHLVPDATDGVSHFVAHPASDNHEIGLPW